MFTYVPKTCYHTPFQGPKLSVASVIPITTVLASGILLLLIQYTELEWLCCYNVHTIFMKFGQLVQKLKPTHIHTNIYTEHVIS